MTNSNMQESREIIKNDFKYYLEHVVRSSRRTDAGFNLGNTAVGSYLNFIEDSHRLFDYNPQKWAHIDSMYDITDPYKAKAIVDEVLKDADFIQRDKEDNQMFRSGALMHYVCFLFARTYFCGKTNNQQSSAVNSPAKRKEEFVQYCMRDLAESTAINYGIRLVTNPVIKYTFSELSDKPDLYHEDSIAIASQVLDKTVEYNADMRDNNICVNGLSSKDIKDAPSVLKKYCDFLNYLQTGNMSETDKDSDNNDVSFDVSSVVESIERTGLIYSDQLIKRYVCSLMTKPFVILSGLAGSGKTQLALAFAGVMSENADEQLCVVPVGADWTNREPLLGYPNALKEGEYVLPESKVLQIMMRAKRNPNKPYFLVLDEMNLSYVERYFADFLSVLESHKEIPLWDRPDGCDSDVPDRIALPKNLFITGTINVDETTYMFSPKVLDRANVIEFKVNAEDMDRFLDSAPDVDVNNCEGAAMDMAADFVRIAEDKQEASKDANEVLKQFFKELKRVNAEFGYRTATEIGRFITLAEKEMGLEDAVDAAIVQKLLPKLHGSRKKIVPVLKELWTLCGCDGLDVIEQKDYEGQLKEARYKLSADKILRMYQCAIDNGFTSFAEA